MKKEKVTELFNDSYQRCRNNPAFMDIFYDRFLSTSPVVREKFKNTDFVRQKRMLRASLLHLISISGGRNADHQLERVAETHSANGYDIEPQVYDFWRRAMLEAVQACDPRFDADIKAAWELTIQGGIDFLISKYQ